MSYETERSIRTFIRNEVRRQIRKELKRIASKKEKSGFFQKILESFRR